MLRTFPLRFGLGIENPTSGVNAIHDETEQEKFFSYVSTLVEWKSEKSASSNGQAPAGTAAQLQQKASQHLPNCLRQDLHHQTRRLTGKMAANGFGLTRPVVQISPCLVTPDNAEVLWSMAPYARSWARKPRSLVYPSSKVVTP